MSLSQKNGGITMATGLQHHGVRHHIEFLSRELRVASWLLVIGLE
jgi:hypothetical protein